MECTIVRDDMLDVLYGAADRATVRRVEEHCGVCDACREELAAFRGVRSRMSDWKLPPTRRVAWPRRPGPRLAWSLSAAAAVLLGAAIPASITGFQRGVLRWQARLVAYHASLVDHYPPIELATGEYEEAAAPLAAGAR